MGKILIIDDDIMMCKLLDRFLKKKGHETVYFTNGKKALDDLKVNYADVVFCDYRLPDTDGKQMLLEIKKINPSIQVIVITAYSEIKTAVDLIKNGAFNYLSKPVLPEEIELITKEAMLSNPDSTSQLSRGSLSASTTSKKYENNWLVGNSKEAVALEEQIEIVAPSNYTVIIYGESGTGKESVASSIHAKSLRKDGPFIAVDCGALTKELAGSELFGHEKGAYTGALFSKAGQFELANGGTIFLDEIANLPYDIQVSLLRVIQERKLKRLGSTKELNIDIRIIAASNARLINAIEEGKFRTDLYHRLNEFSIDLPPLAERNLDIPIFALHFLKKANLQTGKNIESFSPDVMHVFQHYKWPGNLREMNNVIKRAVLLCNKKTIDTEWLPKELIFQSQSNPNKIQEIVQNGIPSKINSSLKLAALQAEYLQIMDVLRKVNYNKSKASEILNINRKTLHNKVKQFQGMELGPEPTP